MMTGLISTSLLPETKGRTLEEMSNEEQQGFVRGELLACVILSPVLMLTLSFTRRGTHLNNTPFFPLLMPPLCRWRTFMARRFFYHVRLN